MFYIYRGKYHVDEIADIEPYLTFDERIGRLLQGATAGTEYEYFDIPDTDYLSLYLVGPTSSPSYAWYASLTGYDENGETIMKYEDVEVVNTMTPLQMADTISEFNMPVIEPIELTDSCQYACAGKLASGYIDLFPDTITTKDITSLNNMFFNCSVADIPFELNCKEGTNVSAQYLFSGAMWLENAPKINYLRPNDISNLFNNCYRLNNIDTNFYENWDWDTMDSLTSEYAGSRANTFNGCYSLRTFPMEFMGHGNPKVNYSYSIYYSGFNKCYVLDEIVDLPFPHPNASWTSNAFNNTFKENRRLKRLTFALQEDGTPYTMKWKGQTIDLSSYVGYTGTNLGYYLIDYNSGITEDKKVYDDATYQALKDDPDWYTENLSYSRYNHTSAVETINSLPDCSATGTNTIKFRGTAGSLTDGGAINTLTEEEIAVATAKGWTVSFV